MTEEYVYERERDLLDYFRNNLTDPSSEQRGLDITETHTATAAQTEFVLNNTLVKNVADTITVDGVTKKKGYDYTVEYGEGKDSTILTLVVAASASDVVVITYHYGPSFIEREYSRSDAQLPRIIMMFLTGSEEHAALGDYVESTKGSYHNAAYRFEIRSKYANQARVLTSQAFNLCKKIRHANLFRTNITRASEMENFDFDADKDCYIWQFSLDIQWEIMFE